MGREAKKYTTMNYVIEVRFWSNIDKEETKKEFRANKQLEEFEKQIKNGR